MRIHPISHFSQVTVYKALITSIALVALMFVSSSSLALSGAEVADKTRVVSLSPDDLPELKDHNPKSYSLFAVRNGRLAPIPFQIDEKRESGFIYMRERSKKEKKRDPQVGRELFFDGDDELLFMFKDAGSRIKSLMRVDGKLAAEMEFKAHTGERRYVYLVKDAVRESDTYYVRFSSELGRVETDYYALKVDPKNAFMWEEFYYDSFVGAKASRPIDTIKLRMYSKALAAIPMNLNNKHMVAKVVSEKSGPIRSTTEYKVTLKLLGSPVMKFDLQIVHHEQSFSYNSRVNIPALRRRMVSKASMNASTDFIDLLGAEIYFSGGPKEPAIVDGETSEVEKQLSDIVFKVKERNWMFVGTKNGFSMLNTFYVETEEDLPMGVVYEESADKELAPEYFKGQMPMAGFKMHRTPLKGFMQITNKTFMYSEDIEMAPDEFEKMVHRDLSLKVFKINR